MSSRLSGYAQSGAWSMVAYAARLVGAVALSILVIRSLTVDQFGVLSIARQFAQIVVIVGGLALERALLRYLPLLQVTDRSPLASRLLWGALALRSALWLALFAFVWFMAPTFENWLRVPLANSVRVAAATGLVFSTHNHLHAAATAMFRTREVAIGSTLGAVSTLAAVGWFLWEGYGVEGVLIGTAVGMAVAAVPMLVGALRGPVEHSGTRGDDAPLDFGAGRVARYVLPFSAIAILNYAVHSQTEVFFLSRFHGPEAAAYFAQGFSFAQRLIDFVPMALWEITLAGFSHVVARDPRRLGDAVRSFLILLYLLIPPIAMLGVAFSHDAMLQLYGAKMLPAVGVSQAYFLVAAVAAAGAPIGMVLYVRERVGTALLAYVVIAAVNLGLDLWWIPRWELHGAVAGLAMAKLVSVGLFFALARRELGELRVPWFFLLRSSVACTPALLWLLVAGRFDSLAVVALGAVGCAAAILLAYRFLGVLREEEAALVRDTGLPGSVWLLRIVGSAS